MPDATRFDLTAVVLSTFGGEVRVATTAAGWEPPELAPTQHRPPSHRDGLPTRAFDPDAHRTLQEAVRAMADSDHGLRLGYVEQLYTFADRGRDPRELFGGPRAVAVGYLALVREAGQGTPDGIVWRDVYEHLPWEDRRTGVPVILGNVVAPALDRWVAGADSEGLAVRRRERVELAFPGAEGSWDPVRVLERYELLYEAGLLVEAGRDRALAEIARGGSGAPFGPMPAALGRPMAGDARRFLATALERLRGKLRYRPVVFELVPPAFTLNHVQKVVEALTGTRLHKQNFRRLLLSGGLVEPTGRMDTQTGGRPAELFRFGREAIHERTSSRRGEIPES